MAFGDALQKRMDELAKRQPMIQRRFREISEGATLRAVEETTAHTPPNTFGEGEQRGVNMITGELAQSWSKDSQIIPTQVGQSYVTTLASDKDYASCVNDGHRVDKHFVPGLYIDDHGLLSYEPSGKDKDGKKIGMMVGTKTTEVPGLYMVEKGVEKFKEVAEAELRKIPGEAFR